MLLFLNFWFNLYILYAQTEINKILSYSPCGCKFHCHKTTIICCNRRNEISIHETLYFLLRKRNWTLDASGIELMRCRKEMFNILKILGRFINKFSWVINTFVDLNVETFSSHTCKAAVVNNKHRTVSMIK
jgi:hypothetical protein